MATLALGNLSPTSYPNQLSSNSPFFSFPLKLSFPNSRAVNHISVRASSSAVVEVADPVVDEKMVDVQKNILACPICYNSLRWIGDPGLSPGSTAGSRLQCSTCGKTYFANETHLDLRVANGGKAYGESLAASTEFFRIPLISFLYERGWRQSFSVWGGFPGPEKEVEMMKAYLQPVLGGNIIDASCGSGIFSRLLAKSGLFSLIVALDYSETMLQQCYEFIKQEENFPEGNLTLVRADISRLPFPSSSVDAIHAGAALHCWPSPSAAVAEISRVLRPGGVFVSTTYILDGGLFPFIPLLGPVRQNVAQVSGSHIFLSEGELEDLCTSCGLEDFKCTRNGRFIMLAARKPI